MSIWIRHGERFDKKPWIRQKEDLCKVVWKYHPIYNSFENCEGNCVLKDPINPVKFWLQHLFLHTIPKNGVIIRLFPMWKDQCYGLKLCAKLSTYVICLVFLQETPHIFSIFCYVHLHRWKVKIWQKSHGDMSKIGHMPRSLKEQSNSLLLHLKIVRVACVFMEPTNPVFQ